jgi:hypothetical protein
MKARINAYYTRFSKRFNLKKALFPYFITPNIISNVYKVSTALVTATRPASDGILRAMKNLHDRVTFLPNSTKP